MNGGKQRLAAARRSDRDMRAFRITDFTDQQKIRIQSQHGTNGIRKLQPAFFIHFDLRDAIKAAFHRIFHSHDAAWQTLKFTQHGIERGGFPGTDPPAHQQHALDFGQPVEQMGLVILRHADLVQTQYWTHTVKQANADHLTVWSGYDRDAQIQQHAIGIQAAMAMFCTRQGCRVHLRKHFEIRNQMMAGNVWHHGHIMQQTVHPHAYPRLLGPRLDVQIRSPPLHGIRRERDGKLLRQRQIRRGRVAPEKLLITDRETRLNRTCIGARIGIHGVVRPLRGVTQRCSAASHP